MTTSKQAQPAPAPSGPLCPRCKTPLQPGAHYCYECNSFLDASGSQVLSYGQVSDQAIEELVFSSDRALEQHQLSSQSQLAAKARLPSVVGLFLGAFVAVLGSVFLGLTILLGSMVLLIYTTRAESVRAPETILRSLDYHQLISRYVTPGVLASVFDRVERYDPEDSVPLEHIQESKLIREPFSGWGGSQLVRAVYRGIPMELCHLRLVDESTDDEDGTVQRQTIFDGLWMDCNSGVSLPQPVRIWTRTRRNNGHGILTHCEEFDQQFIVDCMHPDDAAKFLTPAMIQAILRIYDLGGGELSLLARPDGSISLALYTDQGFLQATDLHEPPELVRERLTNELYYPTLFAELLTNALRG